MLLISYSTQLPGTRIRQLPEASASGSGELPEASANGSGELPEASASGSGELPEASANGSGELPEASANGSGELPEASANGSGARLAPTAHLRVYVVSVQAQLCAKTHCFESACHLIW